MCGILGIYNFEKSQLLEDEFNTALNLISFRGPDQKGVFYDKNIILGHNRLSILDLSEKAKQPFKNKQENIILTYNGEIYNFKEIRNELIKKGHIFNTESDTEVVLKAYEEYGFDCVKQFNGMFAFALWDKNKNILFLARDPIGIKPLYYYLSKNKLIFASEIKAILEFSELNKELDKEALYNFLRFQYISAPNTIFKSIKKLLPGNILLIKNNKIKIFPFYILEDAKSSKSNLKGSLIDAVTDQLVSDVPVGVFLSGGIDSTIITKIVSDIKINVNTFSVGFENDKFFDESHYAKIVAETFRTNHNELFIKPPNIKDLKNIIWHLDEPLADYAAIPTYYLSKFARKKVKVVLTGEGADELFGGYKYYNLEKRAHLLRNTPIIIRDLLSTIFKKVNKVTNRETLINYLSHATMDLNTSLEHWQQIFTKNEIDTIMSKQINLNQSSITNNNDSMNFLLCKDIKQWLPDDLLMKVDKMSMANSLEARVPYLDLRLVDSIVNLSSKKKFGLLHNKIILKNAFKNEIPKEILKRPKHGFDVPINNWLRDNYANEVNEMINSSFFKKVFNNTNLLDLVDKFKDGNKSYQRHIWSLLNLYLWSEVYEEKLR